MRLVSWKHCLAVIVLTHINPGSGECAPIPGIGMPADVVGAWQRAGASVGWMKPDTWGRLEFHREREQTDRHNLPAFQFCTWEKGVVETLPAPPVAFGLSLRGIAVADSDLQELLRLGRLQAIDLQCTLVTDAGLGELARHTHLKGINLSETIVTSTGLKLLANLNELESLDLGLTQVTSRASRTAKAEAAAGP